MNLSTPGLPVHHQLPEFTQTHVHRVGDAIQSSHPLSSPSPPAPTISTSINSLPLNRCCISDKSLYYPAIIITPALILLARPPGKALQGIDDGMALRRESSIHGILKARILEWVAIPFSRGSSLSSNQTQVSCIAGKFFTD